MSIRTAEATVTFKASSDGGRQMPALQGQYRPHLRIGSGEYLGVAFVGEPNLPIEPGTTVTAVFELMYDGVDYSALTEGSRFDILEGPRVVGFGYVTHRRG